MNDAGEAPFLQPPYGDSVFMVATRDFMSGALFAVDIDSRLVSPRIDTLSQDSGLFVYQGFVDLIFDQGVGEYDHELAMINLLTHKRGARLLGPLNFVPRVQGAALLVLSAGTPDRRRPQLDAGLYVGRTDGTPLTAPPIQLGLPPYTLDALTQ